MLFLASKASGLDESGLEVFLTNKASSKAILATAFS
jgi:hypothetical protein